MSATDSMPLAFPRFDGHPRSAAQIDAGLARIYYVQMVERGTHHHKAVCIVAAHLAGRTWAILRLGPALRAARYRRHRGPRLRRARRSWSSATWSQKRCAVGGGQ